MIKVKSFTFGSYRINKSRGTITFDYHVEFKSGIRQTYHDKIILKNISPELWDKIPADILRHTLESLTLMMGINYWCAFPTKNIKIKDFTLTREQAQFWDSLYLNGLGEFFYFMKMDFRDLIAFPYDENKKVPLPSDMELPERSLLLNGAGKDSILSAEILKSSNTPFDFFAFAPTPAHMRIGKLVGANTIEVNRKMDFRLDLIKELYAISNSYPSVSTFTFIATLLSELLGYNAIVFSNESSADFGNMNYLGLEVNHQWCKSSVAEKMINDYVHDFITPSISTVSMLRKYNELQIVEKFVQYPKYLHYVTSCNTYFWLPRIEQRFRSHGYWCNRCPKCAFLFTCFSAFLPKEEVVSIFGADLYKKKRLLSIFKRIMGIEGFKPLDCVGVPEEMILAMHYAKETGNYDGDLMINMFTENFPADKYNFKKIEKEILKK
ncbi:MAG: hypothetical protein KBD48_00650 [Candidatus Pacebacteria bacterium]|nr:hypothetical protein [Candidatus Paceibacterota bacterium]